jgi:hypothetical protein
MGPPHYNGNVWVDPTTILPDPVYYENPDLEVCCWDIYDRKIDLRGNIAAANEINVLMTSSITHTYNYAFPLSRLLMKVPHYSGANDLVKFATQGTLPVEIEI